MDITSFIKHLFNKFGFDIRRIAQGAGKTRVNIGESYSLLRELGFQPKTIIDVGVASGTMELNEAFPDSYFLLIEPLKEFESNLIAILKRYHGSYHLAVAGAETGQVVFNVHSKSLQGSSLYRETMGTGADGYEVTVPMIRIDDIVKEKKLDRPFLIKIDVQGAELDVLEGAKLTMRDAEIIVLEVSLFGFMQNAPQFSDVIVYMKDNGFVAYDIILGWNRPLDNALGQVDIVFTKESGVFRQNHSYSI